MLSGYIFELYTCVQVQKCNKNMCIHTLAPGGRPRVSFFFAGGALPVYDVRNCTSQPLRSAVNFPCVQGKFLVYLVVIQSHMQALAGS
jgi:hypothetical protein